MTTYEIVMEPITEHLEIVFDERLQVFRPVAYGKKILSITAEEPTHLREVVVELEELIRSQMLSENNYGLSFFACGYDGQAQQDFQKYYHDTFQVWVF